MSNHISRLGDALSLTYLNPFHSTGGTSSKGEFEIFGRQVKVVENGDAAWALRKLYNSATMYETRKAIYDATACTHSFIAVPSSQKKIINDDFQPSSWGILGELGRYFSNDCARRWENYSYAFLEKDSQEYSQKISSNQGFRDTALPCTGINKQTITGLSNHTGACRMNASLQATAASLQITLDSLVKEGKDSAKTKLESRIQEKMPTLSKLINGSPMTEKDCQALHAEGARLLAENYWFNRQSQSGIARASSQSGDIRGLMRRVDITTIFLHELSAPEVTFNKDKEIHVASSITIDATNDTVSESRTTQSAVKAWLENKKYTLDINQAPASLTLNFKNSRKGNDVLQHGTTDILKPITFGKSQSSITYQPKAILCGVSAASVGLKGSGHTFSFLRNGDSWSEVNDSKIIPIPKEWEKELESYLSQHSCSIVYEKVEPQKVSPDQVQTSTNVVIGATDDQAPDLFFQAYNDYQKSLNPEIQGDFFTEKLPTNLFPFSFMGSQLKSQYKESSNLKSILQKIETLSLDDNISEKQKYFLNLNQSYFEALKAFYEYDDPGWLVATNDFQNTAIRLPESFTEEQQTQIKASTALLIKDFQELTQEIFKK
ncbi:MAG: hypothetical protein K9M81_02280 [Chthoniobacterales bacterium]|nr:hypothetical protein [Chthoniobacterales bacterium]